MIATCRQSVPDRAHYTAKGNAKVAYGTEREAILRAEMERVLHGRAKVRHYRCPTCKHWHVGQHKGEE